MLPFPGISSGGVRKAPASEPPRTKILESPDQSTNQIVGFSQQQQQHQSPANKISSPEHVMTHGSTNSKKYYGVSQNSNRIRHIHSDNQFQQRPFQEWASLIGQLLLANEKYSNATQKQPGNSEDVSEWHLTM